MLYPNPGVESQFSPSKPVLLRIWPAALFALLVAAVYADPLFVGRAFTGRDLLAYGLPLEKATHEAWARGHLPAWNDDVSGGRPLLPNPNAGALYPLRPLLSPVPFPEAMRLFPVFHWVLAGWGMLALLGALGASREAGWIAAGTYAFSGVIVSEVFYLPLQAGAALQAWALWALVRPARSLGRKALGLGAVYGLMLLAGDAVSVGIALLAAVLWIATELAGGRRARAAQALAAGVLLGALLAAPQLIATALLVAQTQRAVTGLSLGETLSFSLSPWRLLEFVVPYPFGETWTLDASRNWGGGLVRAFFTTLFCGAFAVVAFVAGRGGRGSRFCTVLAAVSAALAVAGTFAPAALKALASPVPLRYPEKLVVGLVFAASVQAGLGFDRIARAPVRAARLALGAAAALAALAACAALWPGAVRGFAASCGAAAAARLQAPRQIPPALAEASLAWVATFAAVAVLGSGAAPRRLAAAALLAVLPVFATRRIALTDRAENVYPPTAFARAIARRDPAGRFRALDASRYRAPSVLERAADAANPEGTAYYRRSWYFHTPSLWGRGTVFNSDLDAGDFSRTESLRRVSAFAAGDPAGTALFESLALRFAIRYRDQAPLPGFAPMGSSGLQEWDENPAALPDARLASGWREAPGAVEALAALPTLSPGEVVLETGRSASGKSADGSVQVLAKSPESLSLATSLPAPGWLFVLRGFWKHRQIQVDGLPVGSVPAQLAFTAIPIPAGEHRVDWREDVPGIWFSWIGPAVFAGTALLLFGRRPRGVEAA
jgi:hypothetical protein